MNIQYRYSMLGMLLVLLLLANQSAFGQVEQADEAPYDGSWESLQKMPVPAGLTMARSASLFIGGPTVRWGFEKAEEDMPNTFPS